MKRLIVSVALHHVAAQPLWSFRGTADGTLFVWLGKWKKHP